ncbi:MAG: DJ-1/PfpI family protein [Planctomycetota bacterium]|nr:DJ-1/PfpI family protein [Planctomycetota bacterium]
MANEENQPEVDADGLPILTHASNVLFIVPEQNFGDQILRYARSSLFNEAIGSRAVTLGGDGPAVGRLQDEVVVDGDINGEAMDSYQGIVICGCDGENPLARDERVARLLRDAHADGKVVASWGNALCALAHAGVVKGSRVTGAEACQADTRSAGGKFTTRQIETAGRLVTAQDESAGMRFGQALVQAMRS